MRRISRSFRRTGRRRRCTATCCCVMSRRWRRSACGCCMWTRAAARWRCTRRSQAGSACARSLRRSARRPAPGRKGSSRGGRRGMRRLKTCRSPSGRTARVSGNSRRTCTSPFGTESGSLRRRPRASARRWRRCIRRSGPLARANAAARCSWPRAPRAGAAPWTRWTCSQARAQTR